MSILAQRGTVAGVTITKIAWLQALQVPGAKVRLILPACFKVASNLEGGKSCPVPVVCREDWFCKDYIETFTTKKKSTVSPSMSQKSGLWNRQLSKKRSLWLFGGAWVCSLFRIFLQWLSYLVPPCESFQDWGRWPGRLIRRQTRNFLVS